MSAAIASPAYSDTALQQALAIVSPVYGDAISAWPAAPITASPVYADIMVQAPTTTPSAATSTNVHPLLVIILLIAAAMVLGEILGRRR